jgi:hypothetical protein
MMATVLVTGPEHNTDNTDRKTDLYGSAKIVFKNPCYPCYLAHRCVQGG